MSQKDNIYCYASQTGKQGAFIKIPCSPLYISDKANTLGDGSLKSSGNGSLNDILHLENKMLNNSKSALKNLNVNLETLYIDLKSRIYEPLLLPVSHNEQNGVNHEEHEGLLHNCTLSCFAEKNGYSALTSMTLETLAGLSALIPKSLIKTLGILEKAPILSKQTASSASGFASVLSILEKNILNYKFPFTE